MSDTAVVTILEVQTSGAFARYMCSHNMVMFEEFKVACYFVEANYLHYVFSNHLREFSGISFI